MKWDTHNWKKSTRRSLLLRPSSIAWRELLKKYENGLTIHFCRNDRLLRVFHANSALLQRFVLSLFSSLDNMLMAEWICNRGRVCFAIHTVPITKSDELDISIIPIMLEWYPRPFIAFHCCYRYSPAPSSSSSPSSWQSCIIVRGLLRLLSLFNGSRSIIRGGREKNIDYTDLALFRTLAVCICTLQINYNRLSWPQSSE